jgi:hypothetical protein
MSMFSIRYCASRDRWIVGTRDVAGEARGVPYTPEVRETADEWAETGSQAWAEIIAARLSRRMTEVTP